MVFCAGAPNKDAEEAPNAEKPVAPAFCEAPNAPAEADEPAPNKPPA